MLLNPVWALDSSEVDGDLALESRPIEFSSGRSSTLRILLVFLLAVLFP